MARKSFFVASIFVLLAVMGYSARSAALPEKLTQYASNAAGDWPMYGHDPQRTNYNPTENTISSGNVGQLISRWQANVGSNGTAPSGAPSVANGRVYVGSSAPTGNNFWAFDSVSGAPAWSTSVGYVSGGCLNVGIGSTAAISGTVVAVGGGDSAFYGLDANTGAQLWRNAMNVGASGFAWESPLLANGRAYLGMASRCDNPSVRGEVRSLDAATGQSPASQYFVPAGQAGGGIWNSPALTPDGSQLLVVTGEDYNGYNGPYNRAMVSLDADTLQILQSFQEGATGQDLDFGTTPVIFSDNQGRLLVGANHKNGVFYTFAVDSITAGPIWTRSTGTSVGMMPAYDPSFGSGGTLFIAGSGGSLYAVDPATGADRWPHVAPGTMHGNMAVANGLIFVNLGSSGLKILSETNGATLRTIVPSGAGAANSGLAVSNGFIYWLSGSYLNAWSLPATTPTPTRTSTPTSTPTTQALLVGHVTWQGRPAQPDALQQLPVTLTLRLASTEVNYPAQNTDASGQFTVTVSGLAPGTYAWRAKGPKFLAKGGTVSLPGSGSTRVEMGLLRTGDADNSNVVNTLDFNIVKNALGKGCGDTGYDDRADFNGDCAVTITDFSLLRANFGQSGAPPP